MLGGCLTTLVTPFSGDGIDEKQLGDFVEWQIAQGIEGLATCALAGEGPTLSFAERRTVVRVVVEAAAGRVPVVAASGSNCTRDTIEMTAAAKAAGAAAALVVAPYYSRPTQEGLFQHFESIARAVDIPIILNNAPLATRVDVLAPTLRRLAAIPAFVGLLDESPDHWRRLVNLASCSHHMSRFETDGSSVDIVGLAPAQGTISLMANVVPALCVAAAATRRAGDRQHEDGLADHLLPLQQALEREPEPAATKYAVSLIRPAFDAAVRLPLTGVTAATAALVRSAVAELARPFAAIADRAAAARHARQIDMVTRGP